MPFSEQNPFVSDPFYFANQTHYVYSQTTQYLVQVTYSGACFSLGILLFSLVCYLLNAQTPDQLKTYRKILVLITIIDLFVLINCVGIHFVSFGNIFKSTIFIDEAGQHVPETLAIYQVV
jgi:hypothetical protein